MQRLVDLDDDERRLLGPFIVNDRPSGNEYRAFCPECEDPKTSRSPSASFNFIRGEWHCMSNQCGGTIGRLMRVLKKREREQVRDDASNVVDMDSRRKRPSRPLPTAQQIDNYKAQLLANSRLVSWLGEKRGLDEESLDTFDIGFDTSARKYVLPVYDADGTLVNVRMYNPKARGDQPKMMPFAVGYGTHLFNSRVLKSNDEVVLTEGEWDCVITNQHGIPAVTHTGGAGAFQMKWASAFEGKHVYICFDEDDGGRKGAIRTARMLQHTAAGVYIIGNLNTGKRSGDITDFFLAGGSEEQFRSLMEEARLKPFSQDEPEHVPVTTGKVVTLEESQSTQYDEPIELNVLVAGKITPPYMAPHRIKAECDQSKGKACAVCPMSAFNGDKTFEIHPDDPRVLNFVEANELRIHAVLADILGSACRDRVRFTVHDRYPIEELVVVQSLEDRAEETLTPMNRKVFNVNTYKTGVNTNARLVGQQVADPRSSRGIFHSWHLEPTASVIDEFHMTDDIKEELAIFQPEEGQSPLQKCIEIAKDLAANITHIYGRDSLHVAYDLVWHSVLDFKFMGKRIDKGWLEGIVIGDTRTGKSETATLLANHYNAGVVKSCEGATFAGLVGGASQVGRNWMVTWGTIPLNDRRLVVLDELSGLIASGGESKGIIEQMSSIRSSGKAQLTKIVSEETSARTRILWISNPIDGKRLAESPGGGMEALRRLIKNPEDIARFDFALAASNTEVPSNLINSTRHEKVPHVYDADSCSKLVLWAWSRKSEHVRFTKRAERIIIEQSEEMGEKYHPSPPLVQVENIRMKLARIAVAFATRTFSTDASGEHVIVTPAHVLAAVEFLDWIYGSESFGYLRESKRIQADRIEAYRRKDEVKEYLRKNDGMYEALRAIMYAESFRPRDFEEFGGLEVDARSAVSLLVSWKMVRRLTIAGGRIAMEPPLLEILKELEDER